MRSDLLKMAFLAFGLAPALTTEAQVIIEVGTGTVLNDPNAAPSPYANINNGSRNQLLFHADELQAAGMGPGTILGLGFNVFAPSGTTLTGFGGYIGTTAATDLTNQWETGLVQAWTAADFTDVAGWSYHAFDTPFLWDGTSNLVIETCYGNTVATQNAQVYQSITSFTSCVSRNSFNPTICTAPGGTHVPWQQRPNTQFMWQSLDVPPVAQVSASPAFTCTGSIAFTDESQYTPTSWEWSFGDDSTSTDQNPTHIYTTSGTFTVQMIATNAFGTDTTTTTVIVDLTGIQPTIACDAPSSGTVENLGILNVTIEGIAHPTGDAYPEGYLDNTCASISVLQGTYLDLEVVSGTAAAHAIRAWIDYDNSGTFTSNELLLSASGSSATSSTLVPLNTVLNTPLRLRVVAAYELVTPDPQACGTIQYGQAEDYSITVLENTLPPTAIFSATPLFSCGGTIQFTDLSENAPTAWFWDLGDTNTSTDQNPLHTYTTSGTFSVSLIAINANGQDDTLATDLITIDLTAQLVAAACTPQTQAYCCGYGILGFQMAGINSTSIDASEGYQDRSCGNTATVQEGSIVPWSITHNVGTPHDTRIWIDLNNDGSFSAGEEVASALNQTSPSASLTMPLGSVYNTPLRLRVQSDVIGQSVDACDAPLYGQTEDFSVIVLQNTNPPTAAFTATPLITCDGIVQFTDLSTNLPTSWSWTFGDGGLSTDPSPSYTYNEIGQYTATLTVTNPFGSSSQSVTIERILSWQCDTLQVSGFNDSFNTECYGILTDDGGPNGNYFPGTSGAYTISPLNAEFVTLTFSQFVWGNNANRVLSIYDGPDVNAPLIGSYTGNGLAQLPNNGVITSTGPSITVRQEQNGGGGPPPNNAGFVLEWNCSLTGIDETAADPILVIRPQPADDRFFVDLAPSQAKRTIVVRNALGQLEETRTVGAGTRTVVFDTDNLPAGIHLLQVIAENRQWTRTIIIR